MWFVNYDHFRVSLAGHELLTWGGIAVFVGLCFLSLRPQKDRLDGSIGMVNAEIAKGMAMFAIVIHHLFIHVLDVNSGRGLFYDVGFIAVAIFLFLSGYGLTLSAEKKGIDRYWIKRLVKVYLPFVLMNLVWLGMDAVIWDKFYTWDWNLRYLSGWVLFDRNYWFIQFLLVNYLMFWVIYRCGCLREWPRYLISGMFMLAVMISDWVPAAKVNIFSFWVGMEVALLGGFAWLDAKLPRNKRWIDWWWVIAGIGGMWGLIALRREIVYTETWDYYFSLSGLTVLVGVLLIMAIRYGYRDKYSRAWVFIGGISFEIFLLHGALMYSYDFILWRGPLLVTFWIYLGVLVGLSWGLHLVLERLSGFILRFFR